jgi:hypothetical protein
MHRHVVLPPFIRQHFKIALRDVLDRIARNPHPTDLLLDSSVFSISRLSFVREILLRFSPIVLAPVRVELEDLKKKPKLGELSKLVFPDGTLHPRLMDDHRGVLRSYSRFSTRYASLLRWRRDAIEIASRRAARETGREPVGKARAKLIRTLLQQGIGGETLILANKEYRPDRVADEFLAVFAVLSPIVTGRDCFVLTADADVSEQVIRMSELLFDDYGAYLIARDLRNDPSRYDDRHAHTSEFFDGEALAIGRLAEPHYLLPPPQLLKTCATTVIDVNTLKAFFWISASNMEPAISFQEADPLARKGDPGSGLSILFSAPYDPSDGTRCDSTHHFVIGKASQLRLAGPDVGPIASFDLFRAYTSRGKPPRQPKILSPFAEHQKRLLWRADAARR